MDRLSKTCLTKGDCLDLPVRVSLPERADPFVRRRHRSIADSLEEADDKSFAFTRLPPRQSESTRTAKGIERRDEAFERRIKTQIVLPGAEIAAMLF